MVSLATVVLPKKTDVIRREAFLPAVGLPDAPASLREGGAKLWCSDAWLPESGPSHAF